LSPAESLCSPGAGEPVEASGAEAEESHFERKARLVALPAALLLAWLLVSTGAGRALGRIFLSMWIHELGHAVAAWLCGFSAMPLPWLTSIADSRSAVVSLLVAAPLVYFALTLWRSGRSLVALLPGGLLLAQVVCTVGLSLVRARSFITFFGDGGCMVLGAALMASFFVGPDSYLRRHQLRWGFLVIGAVAFMDAFELWCGATRDSSRILYGINEAAGLSDPSRLTETYGWTEPGMVRAYGLLGVACLLALAVLYLRGLSAAGWLRWPWRGRREPS
jgi:hypothetical protein